ncbi:MAG: hypothetical protein MZV70_70440 [Desulfobacterales bacterium]|nr:hypothetical protein [Desulfobacterales bacterium]
MAKNASTSLYGNIVALDESPLGGGPALRRHRRRPRPGDRGRRQALAQDRARSPACPTCTYVSDIVASRHDADTVYAAFDNHKTGDFKPYVLQERRPRPDLDVRSPATCRRAARSTPWPRTTSSPTCCSPAPSSALFFTLDGGRHWMQLKGGLPTIAVRDIAIQQRENDLVAGHLRPRLLRPRRLLARCATSSPRSWRRTATSSRSRTPGCSSRRCPWAAWAPARRASRARAITRPPTRRWPRSSPII